MLKKTTKKLKPMHDDEVTPNLSKAKDVTKPVHVPETKKAVEQKTENVIAVKYIGETGMLSLYDRPLVKGEIIREPGRIVASFATRNDFEKIFGE